MAAAGQRRAALEAARGAALAVHAAAGLAACTSRESVRMMRAAEGLCRAAVAVLSAQVLAEPASAQAAVPPPRWRRRRARRAASAVQGGEGGGAAAAVGTGAGSQGKADSDVRFTSPTSPSTMTPWSPLGGALPSEEVEKVPSDDEADEVAPRGSQDSHGLPPWMAFRPPPPVDAAQVVDFVATLPGAQLREAEEGAMQHESSTEEEEAVGSDILGGESLAAEPQGGLEVSDELIEQHTEGEAAQLMEMLATLQGALQRTTCSIRTDDAADKVRAVELVGRLEEAAMRAYLGPEGPSFAGASALLKSLLLEVEEFESDGGGAGA